MAKAKRAAGKVRRAVKVERSKKGKAKQLTPAQARARRVAYADRLVAAHAKRQAEHERGATKSPRLEKLLFVPDTHRPYHDKRAWAVMLKAARVFGPDRVVVLGDFLDNAAISSHSKDPSRLERFSREVRDANLGLDELQSLKAARYDFVEGNHEFRLPRYLQEKAPELCGMDELTIPALLKLKQRGWVYTPYRQHLVIGHLNITHDAGKAGPHAHRQARESFEGNAIIGHTHRMATYYSGNARGTPRMGAMFGWLGDVEAVDYMHRIEALRSWQLGFGIGYLEPATGNMHIQACPIIDYSVVIDGRLVR